MIERIKEHLAVIFGFAAFDIILPHAFVLIEPLAGDKQMIAIDKILVHKCVDKHKVIQVFADLVDKGMAGSGFGKKKCRLIKRNHTKSLIIHCQQIVLVLYKRVDQQFIDTPIH